ncbi:MAG: hypothetical protein IPM59_04705 [Chloracidobacterium sp.]|nr:hypothetical protein [Chloracidobacterium sp.]
MSEVSIQWLTTGFFVLCFVAAIILEVIWLVRRNWAQAPKAVAFVTFSDTIALCVGFFVPFVIIGMILALAWSGDIEKVAGGDVTLGAAIAVAALFPPLFLFLIKRLFLKVFNIRAGREAWLYSLVVTLLSMAVSFVPPVIFYYVMRAIFRN